MSSESSQGYGSSSRRKEPSLEPPAYVLNQHGARVLDPVNAIRTRGQAVRPTIYVGARLLVRNVALAAARSTPSRAAAAFGLRATSRPVDRELAALTSRH